MKLVNIMPARNEDWILGFSARALLRWCNEIVILDHASTDGTPEIIRQIAAENPGRVHSLRRDGGNWAEMEHRQALLEKARDVGATHIATVDADEALAADIVPLVRERIEALEPGRFLGMPMRNLHRSLYVYRSDASPFGGRAGTMLAFADAPELCWRNRNGEEHHQRSPLGAMRGGLMPSSGLLHFQFASWRRLLAKHAWYKMMERLKYPAKDVVDIDVMYNLAPNERGLQTTVVPLEWVEYVDIWDCIDLEREPWQEAECRRLIEEHGRAAFDGLELFGIV